MEDSSSSQVIEAQGASGPQLSLKPFDSLQILYYDNPDGDSLRYTRYFKLVSTGNQSFIDALKKELEQPFQEEAEVRKCISEGKMYLYKNQEPFKTVYFSTRCDSCCYLYYIENGGFKYYNLSGSFSDSINKWKQYATTPVAQ